jgi:hypothetical protein
LAAADRLERQIVVLEGLSTAGLASTFSTMADRQVGGLIVSAFPAAFNNRHKILALAANHKIRQYMRRANMPVAEV